MATPVPYEGAPQVAPEDRPIPYRQLDVPLGAFGGYTAAAVSNLGKTMEGSGDELFQRAYALQQMKQQSDAIDATASYSTALATKSEQFHSLSGKAAVDALPQFQKDIDDLRNQFKSQLGSPYAQLQYDSDTRRLQSWAQMSAGSHAGEQLKRYNIAANEAGVQAAQNSAAMSSNYDAFKSSLDSIHGRVQDLAGPAGYGWSPEEQAEKESEMKSTAAYGYAVNLAKTQPNAARDFYTRATKDGLFVGKDAMAADDFITKQEYGVGSRMIASKAMAGVGFGEDGPVSMAQAKIGIQAAEGAHGNPNIQGPPTKDGSRALGLYQVMPSNLAPWLKEAGMDPMTPQEFLNSKDAQDKLFEFKFGQYMQEYGSFKRAASMWFTGKPDAAPGDNDGYNRWDKYLPTAQAAMMHSSMGDAVALGRGLADKERPGDQLFGDQVQESIERLSASNKRLQADSEYNNKMTVFKAIHTPGQDGKLPTTMEQVLGDPQAKAAYDAMNFQDQDWVKKGVLGNITGKGTSISIDDMNEYKRLSGIYYDPTATPEERNEILSLDNDKLFNMQLPTEAVDRLAKMRDSIYKQATSNPDMNFAYRVLKTDLDGAGIRKADNPDGFNTVMADLHDAMDEYTSIYKKVPDKNAIKEIGSMLIEQHHGWFGVGSPYGTPLTMSSGDTDKYTAYAKTALGRDPYDAEVRDAFILDKFRQYYQKKQAGQQ